MAKTTARIAASIRQRLLNLARNDGRDFQTVLVAFGLERLIHRISNSRFRDDFVLKGGMLVTLWTSDPGRFTRDIDLLKFGNADMESLKSVFVEILSTDAGDGLVYNTGRMRDYYDLWAIPDAKEIAPADLAEAIKATFGRRRTEIPDVCPPGLSEAFTTDRVKIDQWSAFSEATSLEGISLTDVVGSIWEYLEEPCRTARSER